MAVECFAMTRGHTVRVTELDECGNIPDDAVYAVSKGFVTVNIGQEIEAGDELFVRTASGDICVNEKDPDILKRLTLEIDWCQVDPALIGLLTDYPAEVDAGSDTVGFRIPSGPLNKAFAFELWTKLAGSDACADGGACYGYILLPYVKGASLSLSEIGSDSVTFTTSGGYTVDNPGWGTGPYLVVGEVGAETVLETAVAAGQLAIVRTTCVPPPEASCGTAAVDPGEGV